MNKYFKLVLFSALVLFAACNKTDKLTISGSIEEIDNDTLTIKRLLNNQMEVLETKILKTSGKFRFVVEQQEFPQYYFLQINEGRQLIIIKDSLDVIKIKASKNDLSEATITGSKLAVRIQEMNRMVGQLRSDYFKLNKIIENLDEEEQLQVTDEFIAEYDSVKQCIRKEILINPQSYYAYYALYQRLDNDKLLFSPYRKEDYNCFAATATAYDLFHKKDPRTKALYEMVEGVLKDQRTARMQQLIDNAPSTMPDIVMNDVKGVERKLSDLKGKVVILNFWASQSSDAAAMNAELLKLYNKYKGKGLAIYQVSADKSKIIWEDAVEKYNISWITVCDFKAGASNAFHNFNVKQVPTIYLIDREGNAVNKVTSMEQLEKDIKKIL